MYQLTYRSISTPDINLNDLACILEEAIAENSIRKISGCLIYHNENFVQILEGNKNEVLRIFEKITTDKRHHSITTLWEGSVDKRYFSEWNMAYYKPHDKNIKEFVENFVLLSNLSEKSSGSLLSFWGNVRKVLLTGELEQF